ncbi:hypothetical protein [Hydrogenophaga sp. 5NK40-0174]|uniref:hypothetical protein n=1 Tax=Hydrogenophaga sp. 5NK40-0174 TaxID=3127649 RepID=UPI003340EFF2
MSTDDSDSPHPLPPKPDGPGENQPPAEREEDFEKVKDCSWLNFRVRYDKVVWAIVVTNTLLAILLGDGISIFWSAFPLVVQAIVSNAYKALARGESAFLFYSGQTTPESNADWLMIHMVIEAAVLPMFLAATWLSGSSLR